MNQLLLQYTYLQLLDFLTTIAFLVQGVQEGNPLVRLAMAVFPGSVPGLIAVKAAAVLLGIYCWRLEKHKLLSRINILFAVVVAWNLLAMIARQVQG